MRTLTAGSHGQNGNKIVKIAVGAKPRGVHIREEGALCFFFLSKGIERETEMLESSKLRKMCHVTAPVTHSEQI